MQPDLFFVALCPHCPGVAHRPLDYVGLPILCRSCGQQYLALDPHAESASCNDPVGVWLNYSSLPEPPGSWFAEPGNGPMPR